MISGTTAGGVTSQHSYNNHGELWKLRYDWTGDYFQQVLDRDSLGRIVKLTESGISSHTFDYHYDEAGRLDSVAVDGAKSAGYTYDLNGNRVAWRGASAADTATANYDAQDRLARYGDTTYTYTANGELARKTAGGTDLLRTTYDALGNLTGAHLSSGDSLVYLIDGEDRRVARLLNGTRTNTWLYQNGLNLIAELDNSGNVVSRYVYGTQGHVPDLLVTGGVTYRLITDQLGSVRAVVDVNADTLAQRIDYDAWGGRTVDTAPLFQPLGYAGGLSDPATLLVRFGARDYDASVGRWTAKDPLGMNNPDDNVYTYVRNDPVGYIDPVGLYSVTYPPRAGELPDMITRNAMQCLADCLERNLVVTGAKEHAPHKPGSAHETGQACDLGKASNPGLNRDDVRRCFYECFNATSSYAQEERYPPHFHFQTRPGQHGSTGFARGLR